MTCQTLSSRFNSIQSTESDQGSLYHWLNVTAKYVHKMICRVIYDGNGLRHGSLLLVLATSDLNQWGLRLEVNEQIWYYPAAEFWSWANIYFLSLFLRQWFRLLWIVTSKASFLNSPRIPKSGNGQVSHFLEFTQQLAHQEFLTSHTQKFYI